MDQRIRHEIATATRPGFYLATVTAVDTGGGTITVQEGTEPAQILPAAMGAYPTVGSVVLVMMNGDEPIVFAQLGAGGGALTATYEWLAYTPSWGCFDGDNYPTPNGGTQPTIGNGTLVGKYRRWSATGHIDMVTIVLTIGSTTVLGDSGMYRFSLPELTTFSSDWVGVSHCTSAGAGAGYRGVALEGVAADFGAGNVPTVFAQGDIDDVMASPYWWGPAYPEQLIWGSPWFPGAKLRLSIFGHGELSD